MSYLIHFVYFHIASLWSDRASQISFYSFRYITIFIIQQQSQSSITKSFILSSPVAKLKTADTPSFREKISQGGLTTHSDGSAFPISSESACGELEQRLPGGVPACSRTPETGSSSESGIPWTEKNSRHTDSSQEIRSQASEQLKLLDVSGSFTSPLQGETLGGRPRKNEQIQDASESFSLILHKLFYRFSIDKFARSIFLARTVVYKPFHLADQTFPQCHGTV